MRLPRRTVWAIIVALACVDLILRYPQTPHGVGVDSFSFLTLTHAVVSQGRLAWIVHPLSPFGLYPLSYPSGSFALTAAFSDTSGAALEPATLVLSLATGVFGIFSAFTMAREFWRNDIFAINVTIVFSLMPKFLTNTLWEVPTRGLFMALTPLFLWAILRAVKVATLKTLGFAGLMFLLLGLFHRLEKTIVQLQPLNGEVRCHFDPVENGHAAFDHELVHEAFGKGSEFHSGRWRLLSRRSAAGSADC